MKLSVNGTNIHYEIHGPAGAPWLVLSHSLACSVRMWDEQIEAFKGRFRVLAFDTRGHGSSDAPAGPYTLEMLADYLEKLEQERQEEDDGDAPGLLRQVPAVHLLPVLRLRVDPHGARARVEDGGQHLLQRVQELPGRGAVVRVQLPLQPRQLRLHEVRHVRLHVRGARDALVHVHERWCGVGGVCWAP